MKLAVASQGPGPDSPVDPRFGRARYFVVLDTSSGAWTSADNTTNQESPHGAGIQAGRTVAELGVQAVLAGGQVGPKALATLQAGNVAIYTGATGTVAEAVEQFNGGLLARQEADAS